MAFMTFMTYRHPVKKSSRVLIQSRGVWKNLEQVQDTHEDSCKYLQQFYQVLKQCGKPHESQKEVSR